MEGWVDVKYREREHKPRETEICNFFLLFSSYVLRRVSLLVHSCLETFDDGHVRRADEFALAGLLVHN